MTYQKPQVEIVKFDAIGFMTSSAGVSLDSVLNNIGGTTSGNFSCNNISAYNCSGSVTIEGYRFSQRGKSHNWYYDP